MAESQAITYRRMVAYVARELSAKEVKEITYIWLLSILDWLGTGMLKDSLTLATQFVDQTFRQ